MWCLSVRPWHQCMLLSSLTVWCCQQLPLATLFQNSNINVFLSQCSYIGTCNPVLSPHQFMQCRGASRAHGQCCVGGQEGDQTAWECYINWLAANESPWTCTRYLAGVSSRSLKECVVWEMHYCTVLHYLASTTARRQKWYVLHGPQHTKQSFPLIVRSLLGKPSHLECHFR